MIYVQCYSFFTSVHHKKTEQNTVEVFDFGFYENLLCRRMHAWQQWWWFFKNANNKPVENK